MGIRFREILLVQLIYKTEKLQKRKFTKSKIYKIKNKNIFI